MHSSNTSNSFVIIIDCSLAHQQLHEAVDTEVKNTKEVFRSTHQWMSILTKVKAVGVMLYSINNIISNDTGLPTFGVFLALAMTLLISKCTTH